MNARIPDAATATATALQPASALERISQVWKSSM